MVVVIVVIVIFSLCFTIAPSINIVSSLSNLACHDRQQLKPGCFFAGRGRLPRRPPVQAFHLRVGLDRLLRLRLGGVSGCRYVDPI